MTISDTNRVQLSYLAESTFGELVATGSPQILRMTGESLKQSTNSQISNEIISDRQISDLVRSNFNVSGNINLELSYGSYDALLAAALMDSAWSAAITASGKDIQAIQSGNKYQSATDDDFKDIAVGSWVKISGFTTAGNNGYAKVVSVTHSDSPTTENNILTVSGLTLTDEAAGDAVVITTGGEIVNGSTKTSYNIQRQYTDLTNTYANFYGCMINEFGLNVALESMITGSLGIIGKKEVSAAAAIGNAAATAANSNAILNSIDNIEWIQENGAAISVMSFGLQLNNNLRARQKVAELGAIDIGVGQINVSGSLEIYFENSTMFDKYLNFTATSLSVAFEDAAGNGYVIDLPQVKFSDGDRSAGGANQDMIARLSWQAYKDPTELITMRIVRFPAA